MKKNGFTLAEIMITLGIIGVVAALTAPTLVNNAANANIIPTVRKAVSTLEQVNLAIINNNEYDSLADIPDGGHDGNLDEYVEALSEQISGAVVDNDNPLLLHMKGNIDITVAQVNAGRTYNANGGLRGHFADLTIDIDGDGGDNLQGSDRYVFAIDNSGSVLPYGGRTLNSANDAISHWNDDGGGIYKCNAVGDAADTDNPNKGLGCAGSVMENNDINFR